MQVTHITADRRQEWNAFVAQMSSFALLQSWEWGEFKEKLGWKPFRIAVEEQKRIVAGAQMLIKPVPLGLASVAYVPRGPAGDWLDEPITSPLLAELHRVARRHHAIFLKVEPLHLNESAVCQVLQRHHFRASDYSNQPRATITVDLRPGLDDIMGQMRKKTRQHIRLAARQGVSVRVGGQDDLPAFYELMQITGRRCRFSPRVFDYYNYQWQIFASNDQTALLMAFYNQQLLAARMVFCFGEQAAEFHAGSSGEYRDLQPDCLLVWEAIRWAKARGSRTYDLWGIPDKAGQAVYEGKDLPREECLGDLWGVYQFKRGFSKNVILHASAHDYVYSPLLYTLVTNRFLNGRVLDKSAVWADRFARRDSQDSSEGPL